MVVPDWVTDNVTPSSPPETHWPASLTLILYVSALNPVNWTEAPAAVVQAPELCLYSYGGVPPLITNVKLPLESPLQLIVVLDVSNKISTLPPTILSSLPRIISALKSSEGPVTLNNWDIEHDVVDAETFPVETRAFASETITI